MNTDDVNTCSQPITPSLWLTIFLSLVIAVLALFGEHSEASVQFERALMHQGEWCRLLSGNPIPYGLPHPVRTVSALPLRGHGSLPRSGPGVYLPPAAL